ncbi:HET-domain-containing protein, partial [Cadophora sp. DSE1049]
IRLLRVSKRIPFSGLRCQIIHVPLASAPPYESISYCWGTDPPSKSVVIDGKSMKVLDSVNEVLHYRRSFRQEKLLWIDSVCINQNDEAEKGEQIQLMRTIFSEAVGVLAWLGD